MRIDFELKHTWLITGASSGLGREFVRALLARGQCVVASARNVDRLGALPLEPALHRLELDVTDRAHIERAIGFCDELGGVDVLINNAGIGYVSSVEDGSDSDIEELFATNVFGPAALIRGLLPSMRAREAGMVVNISSAGGLVGMPALGYYSASKFALEGLSETLRAELAGTGVDVLLVEPGPVRTNFLVNAADKAAPRLGDAESEALRHGRDLIDLIKGREPGDPARCVDVVLEVLSRGDRPFRLPLGPLCLALVREHIEELVADVDQADAWASATDFDALETGSAK